MRVLFVHQYFKTPQEGSGIRTWHLARAFQSAGHEVKVISGHNSLKGEHISEGVPIHYFKIPYSNYQGFAQRSLAFLKFVSSAKKYLAGHHDFDLLYVLSAPLTTGLIALNAKKKFGLNYLFEVGDLWPLAPIQMGAINNAWLQKKLYQFEERVYKEASSLAGLSPSIKQGMEYTIDYKKQVAVLPNMSDCSYFQPVDNVPDKFTLEAPLVIGYQGAIGKANQLEYLVELAEAIQKEKLPITIRIMGDGAQKKLIQNLSGPVSTISWVKAGGKKEVKEELSKCHVSYISYAPFPVLETGSPNKLFDALASGKLILLNFKGWMSELITKHECGFSYDIKNMDEPIRLLQAIVENPVMLTAYQNNARLLAESEFEVSIITDNAVKLVESIAAT